MQANEIIKKHFDYNNWANDRIFKHAALVSEEDFKAQSAVEDRSLQQILAHMVLVERVWRLLARDGEVDREQIPSEEQLSTVEAIVSFAEQEKQELQAYLVTLSADALAEDLLITRWDGQRVSMTRWHMLVHLALHSMQHRSEAAVLLTQYGHSPGNLDFLFFVI